jgi:polyisoprenoid-binding protein YceI
MAELKKPGWFDSTRVPAAIFTSTSVKSTGAGKYDIVGNLTIKGVVKPVVVPIKLTQAGLPAGQTRADGSFAISVWITKSAMVNGATLALWRTMFKSNYG